MRPICVIPSFIEADSLIEDSLTLDVVIPCLTSGLIRERDDGRTGAIAHGLQGRRAQLLYCALSKASFRRWGWPARGSKGAIKRLRPTALGWR